MEKDEALTQLLRHFVINSAATNVRIIKQVTREISRKIIAKINSISSLQVGTYLHRWSRIAYLLFHFRNTVFYLIVIAQLCIYTDSTLLCYHYAHCHARRRLCIYVCTVSLVFYKSFTQQKLSKQHSIGRYSPPSGTTPNEVAQLFLSLVHGPLFVFFLADFLDLSGIRTQNLCDYRTFCNHCVTAVKITCSTESVAPESTYREYFRVNYMKDLRCVHALQNVQRNV